MTMREKIARALCLKDGYTDCDVPSHGPGYEGSPLWCEYIPLADAALSAMEVPDDGMVGAGCFACDDAMPRRWMPPPTSAIAAAYTAMIQQARKEAT